MSENLRPYRALGERIKFLREQWQQTLSELSATLEIDLKTLNKIESGDLLPSDDQLEMFASHFLLTDDQTEDLYSLASSNSPKLDGAGLLGPMDEQLVKQLSVMLPVPIDNNKVIYSDAMKAQVNDNGVMLQFMQTGPDGKQITVGRFGMSQQHAVEVSKVIVKTLEQFMKAKKSENNRPPKTDKTNSENN